MAAILVNDAYTPAIRPDAVPSIVDQLGRPMRVENDPAWQKPTDPLADGAVKDKLDVIRREIPLSVVVTGWTVNAARAAKQDLVMGTFSQPAQMVDAIILSDSRVQAGLAARLSILGRAVDFRLPPRHRDSPAAKECLDAFVDSWPEMSTEATLGELHRWSIMMGFGIAQLVWDSSGEYAVPHPIVWHPKHSYYHWLFRCYVAISLDGQEPVEPGNGSWVLHAPHGADGYRSWMRGAVGAITPWWLGRAYALRDWMRYSEVHGLPQYRIKTPSVGDPYQQATIRWQVAHIGQGAVFHLPQNPPPALSYDIDLLEARDTAHEGFRMLIEQCNSEITLALLAQTLTTSMPAEGGSSYAAARVHAGVLQGLMESDARALAETVYRQIARPFAAMNFGNADLAPRVVWDVTPYEDAETKARTFLAYSTALQTLRAAGYEVNPAHVAKGFGLDLGTITRAEKPEGFYAYEIDRGVADINEARERKGLKPRDGGDKTWPEIQKDLGIAPGGGGGEQASSMQRIAALMSRIDPRIGKRAQAHGADFLAGDDNGLREAMAEIEAAHASPKRRRS